LSTPKAEIMLGIGEKHELPTILLIDDDLVSREVIATVLTLHGHPVHSAEDGNEALQMLETHAVTPGVVLLDTQLPGLAGRS
jgi:two-component system phosphate regulon response regulator PhoB